MESTRIAREFSQRRLESEQQKFKGDVSSIYIIFEQQEKFYEHLDEEITAIIAYNHVLSGYYDIIGMTLRRYQVSLPE